MEVILTHEHADFDAVASLVGLARLRPDAVPVLPQTVNGNVADFLTLYGGELGLVTRDDLPRRRITRVFLVDTQSAASVRGMAPGVPRVILDHHVDAAPPMPGDVHGATEGDVEAREVGHVEAGEAGHVVAEPTDWRDDIQAVGATSTLLVERFRAAGLTPSALEATLLLLGIHEDTGSMVYAGTTPRDLRAAAWLMEQGADTPTVARFLRHSLSEAGRALYLSLVASAETVDVGGHRLVVASAAAPGFAEEVATLATRLTELLEPDGLCVLVDLGPVVQLVVRSANASVDAGVIAEALGGGGHAHAAAATIRGSTLEAARARVVGVLPAAVRVGLRVADIMSRGRVRTLDAEATVEAALVRARRFGHEGFPVVEGERVLGVVTRRDLDRAAHHNLGPAPVRQLLAGEAVVVAPEDSVDALQQRMTEHGLGQVPVVEAGRLVGIVTRTDLLDLWAARVRRAHPHTSVDLAAHMAPAGLTAIHRIAEVARERGDRAYLVGGLPRDLLLGVAPGPDIDVVIEGDAVVLAAAVAEKYGGQVRAHPRFGTAKWIRADGSIDLVSARAEYYAAPSELPTVERGSLRSDLQRRDFTINTLAIDISPGRFGQVIDWFQGLADLRAGRIRVLHPLSFVEDPTRIIRAIRLASRLGFALDPGTEALIAPAVALLGETSGHRVREALRQLFREPDPAPALERLEAMGVLEAISGGLTAGERTARILEAWVPAWSIWRRAAPQLRLARQPSEEHALILWLAEQGKAALPAAARLRLPQAELRRVREAIELRGASAAVTDPLAPASTVYHQLRRLPPDVLVLAWIGMRDASARRWVWRYATELVGMKSRLTPPDLAALGIRSGPLYGRALRAALDARLDGQAATKADELAIAASIAAGAAGDAAGSGGPDAAGTCDGPNAAARRR